MKNLLSHLPFLKQQELHELVDFIRQQTDVKLIVLFGSYARGDWVEEYAEDGIHFQYQSDFDLLIVVDMPSTSEQSRLEREIKKAIRQLPTIQTPVSLIVHDINFVNDRLAKAQYFFSDIKKEGILLYGDPLLLRKPRRLKNQDRYHLAKDDFDYWFQNANEFRLDFEGAFQRSSYKNAAFLLHQVTERVYSAILLVFTRYKPNTHSLQELRHLVNALDPRFVKVFSMATVEEERCFDLLCKAYVDARYKKSYAITEEELNWLSQEVQRLSQLGEALCQEKINSFLAKVTI